MHSLARLGLLSAALLACGGDASSQPPVLPRAMERVAGLRPGRSVRELQRDRPGVRFAPYVGYEERVDGLTFRYLVPGSADAGDPGGSVQAVEAVARHPRAADARAAWRSEFREYAAKAGGTAVCYRIKGTVANNGVAAVWKSSHGYVSLRALSGSPARGRARATTPAVIWRLDADKLPPVLAAPGAQSIDCGEIENGGGA